MNSRDDHNDELPEASRSGGSLDLPVIMSAREWRKRTASLVRSRSSALKLLDSVLDHANQQRSTAEAARAKYLATLNDAAAQEGRMLSPIENNGQREGLDFAAATLAYDSALKDVEAAHRGWRVAEPDSRRNRKGAGDELASQLAQARQEMRMTVSAVEHIARTLDPSRAHIGQAAFEDDRNQHSPSVASMAFAAASSPPSRSDSIHGDEQPAPLRRADATIRRAAKRDSLQLYPVATADQLQASADSRRPMRRPRANEEQLAQHPDSTRKQPRQRSDGPQRSSPEASGSSQNLAPTRGRGRR